MAVNASKNLKETRSTRLLYVLGVYTKYDQWRIFYFHKKLFRIHCFLSLNGVSYELHPKRPNGT